MSFVTNYDSYAQSTKDLLKTKALTENLALTFDESNAGKTIFLFSSYTRFNASNILDYLSTVNLRDKPGAQLCILIIFISSDETEANSVLWNMSQAFSNKGILIYGLQGSNGLITQGSLSNASLSSVVSFIKA